MKNKSKKVALAEFWVRSKTITDERVIAAFLKVRRENFVLSEYIDESYDDNPLPILSNQTISQPTTVVLMLQALELRKGLKILEVGAGSGYNAALLGSIVGEKGKVISVEIVPELVDFAQKNLKKEGINNVRVILHDDDVGYKTEAPFDRIIVTAAAREVPKELLQQLKDGGVLLIPVGPKFGQKLLKIKKSKGKVSQEDLGDFMFVPLVH